MRSVGLAAGAIALILLGGLPAPASDSGAAGSPPQSEELTKRALQYLEQAERAESKADKVGAYETGRDLAKQALALDDNNADAHFVVFATEGRLELLSGTVPNPMNLYKAQARLDHVLELDPSHSDGLAAKGGLYRQLPWMLGGDLDKAESYLKKAIDANPEAIGARIELAATYLAKGEKDKCPALLDQASALAKRQGKEYRLEEVAQLRAEIDSD